MKTLYTALLITGLLTSPLAMAGEPAAAAGQPVVAAANQQADHAAKKEAPCDDKKAGAKPCANKGAETAKAAAPSAPAASTPPAAGATPAAGK